MSKTLIRIKNNDYPYFTDNLVREGGWLKFETTNKKGETRRVELSESEVVAVETLIDKKPEPDEDEDV